MLTLRSLLTDSIPVELDGILPERVRDQSADEIARLKVWQGNRSVPLGELFAVSGDAADGRLQLEGALTSVHRIGAGMTDGEILATGSVGRRAGAGMRGGRIILEQDAGDGLGEALAGGLIRVRGRAGHLVGAALPGAKRGMTGGAILIEGDVGDEAGLAMRRGLIAVGGRAGNGLGSRMIAGTILAFGAVGLRPGAGMKRGTIGLFGGPALDPAALGPTFVWSCRYRPQFLGLYWSELLRLEFAVPEGARRTAVDRYCGDLAELGKGEILLGAC